MKTIQRIESDNKPNITESLGTGYWYYNYDIKQEEKEVTDKFDNPDTPETKTVYTFIQVRISGKPTYDKCVKAVIRAYIDENQEFDLVNSYNAYQQGIGEQDQEYIDYLSLVKEIKEKVSIDFSHSEETPTSKPTPRQVDILNLISLTINTMSLTDQESLSVKVFYPYWDEFIGKELTAGMKVQYEDKLFKVIQTHTAQEGWEPSILTASLFTEIVENHAGTLEDPIPYPADGNMVIYNGKYYTENNILYICIRDSQQPLYTALANVVGNYVNLV